MFTKLWKFCGNFSILLSMEPFPSTKWNLSIYRREKHLEKIFIFQLYFWTIKTTKNCVFPVNSLRDGLCCKTGTCFIGFVWNLLLFLEMLLKKLYLLYLSNKKKTRNNLLIGRAIKIILNTFVNTFPKQVNHNKI